MRRFVLLALAAVLLAPADAVGKVTPGFVRGCDARVESENLLGQDALPNEYRHYARIGPLLLVADYAGADASDFQHLPARPGRYDAAKVLVLAHAGPPATLAVGPGARRVASLLYESAGPGVTGAKGYRVADGDRAVRFEPCRPDEPALVGNRTVGAWTAFNGGLVVAGARCVPLEVYVTDRDRPFRATISFGAGRCR